MPGPIKEHTRVTGLSGNEIYCLNKLGMTPGQLCVGNSVLALGVGGGIFAAIANMAGGEVDTVTQIVHDGRTRAFNRMMEEAKHYGGVGLTGVSFDVISHGGNLEFVTFGSTVHKNDGRDSLLFSTSADAQQLYCQMDAGFQPLNFVFGNVAYSIGIGGNILGGLRSLKRGEVEEYSRIFDRTRHLALERITAEAKKHGANAVIGIQTNISYLMGAQEMMMFGTASRHAELNGYSDKPVTSDMTNEEMWNMVSLGYMPIRLVMGVSVYSLGIKAGFLSALQSLGGGEVKGLTELLYEAREKALARIEKEAELCGADKVIGVKTRVYDLGGGLVEFMAIGTAVKKMSGVGTMNENLPPQAIMQDRETFVESLEGQVIGGKTGAGAGRLMQKGPLSILMIVLFGIFYIVRLFLKLN